MTERKPHVLIIDDDPGMCATLSDILNDDWFSVKSFGKGREALDWMQRNSFDAVIADIRLPDVGGIQLLEDVRQLNPESAVIIMTGHASVETAVEAMKEGAFAYVVKPFEAAELKAIVKKALKQIRLSLENKNLIDQLQNSNRDLEKAKESIERQSLEIKNANSELEHFAHIVSHDLKAPLRAISWLATWLSREYAEKFDEEGKAQIKLLLGRVHRMHDLIDGILEYSRAGQMREEKTPVDLEKLLEETIAMIAPPNHIEIKIETKLPLLICQRTRIEEVFQNLLSNAVKYMNQPAGLIKVGCVEDGRYWKFWVSDNGPGIEERYFEKIFQIFQTLAPRDEHESAGVGLSVVKKIVETYGGKVWVESKTGKGSTFFFTLPK